MNHQFWNKAAIYGILLALITILFSVLQTVLPSDSKILGFSLWAIKLAGTVGLLFYVMKDFGKGQDTYLYANAFKFGLAVSFCSSIIAAAYYYLHVMFLFPESSSQNFFGLPCWLTEPNTLRTRPLLTNASKPWTFQLSLPCTTNGNRFRNCWNVYGKS